MRINQIVIKLGGTILFLFLMVLLPLGFAIDRMFTGFYYNEVQTQIDQLSLRYAGSVAHMNSMHSAGMIEMMADFSNVKIVIVNSQGEVVARSSGSDLPVGTKISHQDLLALSKGESIRGEMVDPETSIRYLVSGNSIQSGLSFSGAVYVFSSVEGIHQSIHKVRNMLILSGIGALFLAFGFTYVFSKKIANPLLQMEQATRQIAKGDLDTRVTITSNDEIGSLAKAINDLAYDLQKYRDSRQEFFANISHELRTPMTYLEGYTKVVKDGLYQSEEEKDRYLAIIHDESIRLSGMITDLFELAKMEEGKIGLHLEWIDLSEVVESAIQKTSLKAKEKGLDLRQHIQEELPLLYCDGQRLTQIFINLIDNAIRYTEAGFVSVRAWRDQDHIKITVEDTGIGIPDNELDNIFDRFYRVEKSRSRQYGGTGLGLAIVKNLVELQGGAIEVRSTLGKGTCFEITFPVITMNNDELEGSA